jgi:adenylate kinase family enzyme
MKIYIIGAAGSGKTTLATKIGNRLNIPSTNLDDIFWNNSSDSFGVNRDVDERNTIYRNILKNNSWIIEGAYIEWPKQGLYESDIVLFLNIGKHEINRRLIKRFVLRKLGIQKCNKKETVSEFMKLFKWNNEQIAKINNMMSTFRNEKHNVLELKTDSEISKYLSML